MKKILIISALVLSFFLSMQTFTFASSNALDLVVDGADVLTDEQEAALEEMIEALVKEHKMHFVIVTVTDLGYKSAYSYADSYYHDNGYGEGEDRSGILLLISTEYDHNGERDYYIYTYGEAEDVFDSSALDDLEEATLPHLKKNEFYKGFKAYLNACDKAFEYDLAGSLLIAVVAGAIVSLIIVFSMKSKLRSVRPQKTASNYVRTGSFMLTKDLDLYLYRTVTRTRRAQNNSSGSSGGGSRGGGRGGKF
jgi:uncharacterized protein